MSDKTQLNPILGKSATVLNEELLKEAGAGTAPASTALNPDLLGAKGNFLQKGFLLDGRYRIEEHLNVISGEADLYLCTLDEEKFIAKIYKRKFAVKQEVIDALRSIDCPCIAKLCEAFDLDGYPVEIIPYYKNGSLQGSRCTFDELKEYVIPDINRALRTLHRAGILHKDLKPANIMRCDDGKHVVLIDFGISSVLGEGRTVLITKTGMTPEYSAPETFKNVFLEESDYYSFGISLFELFCGCTPYAGLSGEEIEQYVSVQRIPVPSDVPLPLQQLISALTYYDITNRKAKDNPNRRWTFEEVERWLAGEEQILPGEGTEKKTAAPYVFVGKEYTGPGELAAALATNWDEGKKHLFRGLITKHFRYSRPEIAQISTSAEQEAAKQSGRDDIIFWKFLYRLDPARKGFSWKGQTFENLPAMGRELLEQLWQKNSPRFSYYETVLQEKLLTAYAETVAPDNEALRRTARAIEDSYAAEKLDRTDLRRTFFLMGYTLSGQKIFRLDGEQFRTVDEFASYLRGKLNESYKAFEKLCHRLSDYDGNLDVQLETWLIAIGKQQELEQWRVLINE